MVRRNLTMSRHWPAYLGIGVGLLVATLALLAWLLLKPLFTFYVDADDMPKFITANMVQLDNYGAVSKFRSGAGHDFSSGGETCRSMKHYYLPKSREGATDDIAKIPQQIDHNRNLPVFSPTDGEIVQIASEQHPLGKQIYIRPNRHDAYTVRLFHVYPLDALQAGAKVNAGERIGSVLPWQQTDVAVQVLTLGGPQFVSAFNAMDEATLANYKERGASGPDDFIIARETRDAQPLTCNGESFTDTDTLTGDHWLFFADFTPPHQQ